MLSLALILPGSAGAAKLKTRSNTVLGSGNQAQVTSTATCPKGTRALGGGFSVSPAFAADPTLLIGIAAESRKLGQRSWTASAYVFDGPPLGGSVGVLTQVHCRADAPKTKAVSLAQSFPAADAVGLATTAQCAGGRKAMAGGFSTDNPIRADGANGGFVTDSFRVGKNAWASFLLTTGIKPMTVTTYAYCAKGGAPKEVAGDVPVGASLSPEHPTALTAPCPGKRAIGAGGFKQSGTASGTASFIESSLRQGKSWSFTGGHVGGAQTLTALGYCS